MGVCTGVRMASKVLQPGVLNTAPLSCTRAKRKPRTQLNTEIQLVIFEPPGLGQTIKFWVWKLQHSRCSPVSCRQHAPPGAMLPRGCVFAVLRHPKTLGDAESSPGVLWASAARKIMLWSRMNSEPIGAVLEAGGGAAWGCVLGVLNLGGPWPCGLHATGQAA